MVTEPREYVSGRERRLRGEAGQVSESCWNVRRKRDAGSGAYSMIGERIVRGVQTSRKLESRMRGNQHVRFGGGSCKSAVGNSVAAYLAQY